MNDSLIIVVSLLLAIVMSVIGWVFAHNTVAQECEKLGAFYVGNTVYECRVKQG